MRIHNYTHDLSNDATTHACHDNTFLNAFCLIPHSRAVLTTEVGIGSCSTLLTSVPEVNGTKHDGKINNLVDSSLGFLYFLQACAETVPGNM
jgi:hypothetical protein